MTNPRQKKPAYGARGAIALFMAVLLAGCDVTNPGPVQDEFLDASEAHSALVAGAERLFADALGNLAYTGGVISREVTASGLVGRFGIAVRARQGTLHPDDKEEHWELPQQARWVAEDGLRRMERTLEAPDFASSAIIAEGYLYAGFANRLLGENMCDGVIDGGPRESHAVYFERAVDHFTNAMQVGASAGAGEVAMAARAGRAGASLYLGDLTGAASDASGVPTDFAYRQQYASTQEFEFNRVYWTVANSPYRAHSVVETFYETYYPDTGDPRTSWDRSPDNPVGGPAPEGPVEWLFQTKYTARDAPIDLTDGREMRLIEAEVLLRQGQWEEALEVLNSLRTSVTSDLTGEPLEPWTAGNAEEAWTALKRERGIELWLEGRRLGDLRRWSEAATPGSGMPDMSGRSLCWPIATSELDTNENL